MTGAAAYGPKPAPLPCRERLVLRWIVLQKSKVAELRIFRENRNQEQVADSYNLNCAAEVAHEFNVRQ
jgi:hypothetical protein